MDVMIAVIPALVVGFLAGLLTFKVKSRWCPQCGTTTYLQPAGTVPTDVHVATRPRGTDR